MENLIETITKINKNGNDIRQDNRTQTAAYINKICAQIEELMRDKQYHMPIRIAGNINDILSHLKVNVCDVNDEELRRLTQEAIADIETIKEDDERNSLGPIEESTKDREEASMSPRRRKEEKEAGQKDYQNYVQEAMEEIKRYTEAAKRKIMMNGERGSAIQLAKVESLQMIIGNLPEAIQGIHDKSVHEITKMIQNELGKVQEVSSGKEASSGKRLVWDLENYGTTRQEVNDKIDKVIEKEVTKDKTETRRPPALTSNIIR